MFYDQRKVKQVVKFMIILRLECVFSKTLMLYFLLIWLDERQNMDTEEREDLPKEKGKYGLNWFTFSA